MIMLLPVSELQCNAMHQPSAENENVPVQHSPQFTQMLTCLPVRYSSLASNSIAAGPKADAALVNSDQETDLQERLQTLLIAEIDQTNISHTYLFTAAREVGRKHDPMQSVFVLVVAHHSLQAHQHCQLPNSQDWAWAILFVLHNIIFRRFNGSFYSSILHSNLPKKFTQLAHVLLFYFAFIISSIIHMILCFYMTKNIISFHFIVAKA